MTTTAGNSEITKLANQPFIASAKDVTKTFGSGENPFTALRNVTLHIPAGKTVALLGRSGSGKSTLLNLFGAVDRATSGAVIIHDTNLADLSDADLALFRRRKLGFVFQSFHLV